MYHLKKLLYLFVFIGFSAAQAGSYEDFFSAIAQDNPSAIERLLQRGFDPNSVDPQGQYGLMVALRGGAWKVAARLIAEPSTLVEVRTEKDESPLMMAAIKGQFALCEQLIAREADVNKPGWTALHYAASGGYAAIVQLLLDHYAYIDAASPNGSTPLMMAAMYGSSEAVKLLLDAGADPSLKNARGLTALDFAQRASRPDALALLIKATHKQQPEGDW